jgi:hypothetical protein
MKRSDIFPEPKRKDGEAAQRWRGPLFWDLGLPIGPWLDKAKGYYESWKKPNSVTFPICSACGHVIWDWPHFEEPVPEGACCEACFKEDNV